MQDAKHILYYSKLSVGHIVRDVTSHSVAFCTQVISYHVRDTQAAVCDICCICKVQFRLTNCAIHSNGQSFDRLG